MKKKNDFASVGQCAAHIVLRPFSSRMNAKEIFGLQRSLRCIMSIIIYTTNTIYYYYFCTYFSSSSVHAVFASGA